MTDDDLHDLAAAYAVDALDPIQARRFEAHLAGCADCRTEVADLSVVTAQLGEATASPPPAALRARVLAQVATTPQVPRPAAPVPFRRQGRARRAPWPVVVAAAILVLVAGAGLLVRDLVSERDRAQDLAAVLAAGDARDAPLQGTTGGAVRVVWSPSHHASVLVADDLPPAASGHAYELWTFTPSGPVSAGVFDPDPDGKVRARLRLPDAPVEGWGVTVEPIGGRPEPEGELVLRTA